MKERTMDIRDLTKAFWILNSIQLRLRVTQVIGHEIYLENGIALSIPALVKKYDREYGE